MFELVLIAKDGARDYYFHASLNSARALWVRAEIIHH